MNGRRQSAADLSISPGPYYSCVGGTPHLGHHLIRKQKIATSQDHFLYTFGFQMECSVEVLIEMRNLDIKYLHAEDVLQFSCNSCSISSRTDPLEGVPGCQRGTGPSREGTSCGQ